MNGIRLLLILANLVASVGLAAVPIAILAGLTASNFSSSLIFGWFIFFIPFSTSLVALFSLCYSFKNITRKVILVAFTSNFLIAFLPLFMIWKHASADFIIIGSGVSFIAAFNIIALWIPFKKQIAANPRGDNNQQS